MEDSKIIELYWQRSEQAISETAGKYGRLLRSIAMNILNNFSDAEECENDTYAAAWNAIPPTRPNVFSAFLGKITRNIALNRWEYNRAARRNREFDLVLEELEECVSGRESVESLFEAGQLAELINEFLKGLKRETRVIFVRRYWYSDPVKEIASRLRISESKVEVVLFGTREQLKNFLEERGVCL